MTVYRALAKPLADEGRPYPIKVSAICPEVVADELGDAFPADIECSKKIDPLDVAEAAIYLSALAKYAAVYHLVIDQLGTDWQR